MHKIIIAVISFLIGAFPLSLNCIAYSSETLKIQNKNIEKIEISVTISPVVDSPYCYDYSTSSEKYIEYIIHVLNAIKCVDDGKTINGGDIPIVNINIVRSDGLKDQYGFVAGRFYDNKNKQYAVDNKEYEYILSFFYALKNNKIILEDKISFTPSEWAQVYVESAIDSGLVPKLNQINYTGNITRLEVCQLAANLLKNRGYIAVESKENPFEDTSDESVIMLYNAGVTDGKTETEFCPYDFITREELAKILLNVYTLISDGGSIPDVQISYTDSAVISEWALDSVRTMTSLGIFIGDENGNFRPLDNTTKEQVIVTLLRVFNLSVAVAN